MAPSGRPREPSIDRTTLYDEFIAKLTEFHEKRGTSLDPEPRVGNRHVDLLRFYNAVVARGGYDVVSKEKLAWRKMGQDFNLGSANLPTLAFSLKTTYYKYLAAYEIKHVHGKEPPPKEILEDISARGADILTRTVENFRPHGAREQGYLANSEDGDGSAAEDHQTPKEELNEIEDPSSVGRATRGLRQAPPQRILFQPDLSSTRQSRHSSANINSPQPSSQAPTSGVPNTSDPRSASFNLANYEPRPQMPVVVKPVSTPGNNPTYFASRDIARKEAQVGRDSQAAQDTKGLMIPGTGFFGPNIYIRALCALRSGVREEEDYAIHHLVKISHERGDKYKFDVFEGLADALIEYVLGVGSLFYDVSWRPSYVEAESYQDLEALDGVHGTPDILDRIRSLRQLGAGDMLETKEFSRRLVKITEASLVIRNMVLLEENAGYMSTLPLIRDFLAITLQLPRRPDVVELKHYALEIAEQLTKFYSFSAEDALYTSLLEHLESHDRGALLTSLQAISRISMNLEESNRLPGIPVSIIRKLYECILLDDEELVHACLDFFYQYTAVPENVDVMAEGLSLDGMINRLVRYLLHGAKAVRNKEMISPPVREPAAQSVLDVPGELLIRLQRLREPERCTKWLHALFEEDAAESLTQITLWQTYSRHFAKANNALLQAADFIKNISSTFTGATAQVVTIDGMTKFIIKGIRPRNVPVSLEGKPFLRCQWTKKAANETCDQFFSEGRVVWDHVIKEHLQLPKGDAASPSQADANRRFNCRWGNCTKYRGNRTAEAKEILGHIRTHLPDKSASAATKKKNYSFNRGPGIAREAEFETKLYLNTAVDERGEAAGLPLTAALVLRNLARNLPRGEEEPACMTRLFAPVKAKLWYVMTNNRPLAGRMAELLELIAEG
ncbi:MAG: hypothetical protein M1825_005500 [Sarcosagium campestre]|nr:MAG: hypothetical protein M1825_005500 [Sarcosagium campestre]